MKKIGIIVVVLITIIAGLSAYFGAFYTVKVKEELKGPYYMVYKYHQGDYSKVGPVMDEIYNDLKNNKNLFTSKGFGLYYDNPEKVKTEDLRSVVGCIVPLAKLEGLEGDYKIAELPQSKAVVSTFPYKAMPSFIFGVIKVYPVLSKYITDNVPKVESKKEFAIMEVYDMQNSIIEYIAPVNVSDSVFTYIINNK